MTLTPGLVLTITRVFLLIFFLTGFINAQTHPVGANGEAPGDICAADQAIASIEGLSDSDLSKVLEQVEAIEQDRRALGLLEKEFPELDLSKETTQKLAQEIYSLRRRIELDQKTLEHAESRPPYFGVSESFDMRPNEIIDFREELQKKREKLIVLEKQLDSLPSTTHSTYTPVTECAPVDLLTSLDKLSTSDFKKFKDIAFSTRSRRYFAKTHKDDFPGVNLMNKEKYELASQIFNLRNRRKSLQGQIEFQQKNYPAAGSTDLDFTQDESLPLKLQELNLELEKLEQSLIK